MFNRAVTQNYLQGHKFPDNSFVLICPKEPEKWYSGQQKKPHHSPVNIANVLSFMPTLVGYEMMAQLVEEPGIGLTLCNKIMHDFVNTCFHIEVRGAHIPGVEPATLITTKQLISDGIIPSILNESSIALIFEPNTLELFEEHFSDLIKLILIRPQWISHYAGSEYSPPSQLHLIWLQKVIQDTLHIEKNDHTYRFLLEQLNQFANTDTCQQTELGQWIQKIANYELSPGTHYGLTSSHLIVMCDLMNIFDFVADTSGNQNAKKGFVNLHRYCLKLIAQSPYLSSQVMVRVLLERNTHYHVAYDYLPVLAHIADLMIDPFVCGELSCSVFIANYVRFRGLAESFQNELRRKFNHNSPKSQQLCQFFKNITDAPSIITDGIDLTTIQKLCRQTLEKEGQAGSQIADQLRNSNKDIITEKYAMRLG